MGFSSYIFCSLFSLALASDVLEYSDSNFASQIGSHDIALVEFFAPWCGHCKKLAPEYEKAATTLVGNDPPVPLIKVDCTANTETCQKYGVSGYPTLKIFRGGELEGDYSGGRNADDIVRTMKGKAGPASREIATEDDFKAVLNKDGAVVIGFFSSPDSDIAKAHAKAASAMSEGLRFAHTSSAEVATAAGHDVDTVVLYRPKVMETKMEPTSVVYDGDASAAPLKTFITNNQHGLVGHRTPGNGDSFRQPLVTAYFAVDYVKNAKGTNYWRNRVIKVAKDFDDFHFCIANKDEFAHELSELWGALFAQLASTIQLGDPSSDDEKPVVAARSSDGKKYVMTAQFDVDALRQFVTDLKAGSVEPYIKSEPVPDNSASALKVAVARNFDELVNDPERDVLIEFYAPWCGHCKNLAPVYEELAEKLKDEPSLTIAKMDATANDVPSPYQVSGFPTLYYAPKGGKASPKKYEGGRELNDFVKYLAKESTDGLEGYDRSGKKTKKDEL